MTTPGASAASEEAARFGSGRPISIFWFTTWETFEDCDSTSGAASVTVTVWLFCPTWSVRSSARTWPTSSTTGPRTRRSNPSMLTSRR